MLEELKKIVKLANKDATDEQITAIAKAIETSGKFIPEQKYLDIKKTQEQSEKKITELQQAVDAYGDLKPEDAAKASEELKTLQEKVAESKAKAEEQAKLDIAAKHKDKVRTAIIAKLKESGAVDPELVAEQTIAKAGGADKVTMSDDGNLASDITFAIEHVKTAHPTNFTEIKSSGGGTGDGAGGGSHSTWTPESVKTYNEGKTDQEIIDNARADADYAKAAGLNQYITEEK